MKIIIIIILVLLLAGVGFYYFNLNTTPVNNSQKQTDTSVTQDLPQDQSTDVTISIKNFTFNPQMVKIKKGTKVTWINEDTAPHTATSYSDIFDSKTLSTGQSFSFTFNDSGSVNYYCSLHPNMNGTIIVE